METSLNLEQFIKISERIKIFLVTTSDPIKERVPGNEAFSKYETPGKMVAKRVLQNLN